jgi:hypothetical protein
LSILIPEWNSPYTDVIRYAYNIPAGKPEGKRPLGGCRRIWEDCIKTNLKERAHGEANVIHLPQYRDKCQILVSRVTNLRAPQRLKAGFLYTMSNHYLQKNSVP